MYVGGGNPVTNSKPDQNIKFGLGIPNKSQVLGGANRQWMLVVEIRLWTEDSNRILGLVDGVSFRVRYWEEPIESGCWCWKSGYGQKT